MSRFAASSINQVWDRKETGDATKKNSNKVNKRERKRARARGKKSLSQVKLANGFLPAWEQREGYSLGKAA